MVFIESYRFAMQVAIDLLYVHIHYVASNVAIAR